MKRLKKPSERRLVLVADWRRDVLMRLPILRLPLPVTLAMWVRLGLLDGKRIAPRRPTRALPTPPGKPVTLVRDSAENRRRIVELASRPARVKAANEPGNPLWDERIAAMVAEQMLPYVRREQLLETHVTFSVTHPLQGTLNLAGLFSMGVYYDRGQLPRRLLAHAEAALRRAIAAHLSEFGIRKVRFVRQGWVRGARVEPVQVLYPEAAGQYLRPVAGGGYELTEPLTAGPPRRRQPTPLGQVALAYQRHLTKAELRRKRQRKPKRHVPLSH